MRRIGIAASKMSKGNLVLYNIYVVLMSFLFSSFVFVIAGATVIFAVTIISYIGDEIMDVQFQRDWSFILVMCLVALAGMIGLFNFFAILRNIKIPRRRK